MPYSLPRRRAFNVPLETHALCSKYMKIFPGVSELAENYMVRTNNIPRPAPGNNPHYKRKYKNNVLKTQRVRFYLNRPEAVIRIFRLEQHIIAAKNLSLYFHHTAFLYYFAIAKSRQVFV